VIGREFNTQLLKEILKRAETVDPSLKDLISLELVLEQEEAKEFAYLFKHYLIQEVAYNTILQKKRKELHALIARAIEKLYADKLKEFYELLAFHYERAEEWEKAADYLGRAGRKVGEIFSKDESNAFAQRKEEAIRRLFESAGERRLGWTILSVLTAAVAAFFMVLTIFPTLFVWAVLLFMVTHVYFVFDFGTLGMFFMGVFGMPWVSAALFFFGVLPATRRRAKVIELLEDQVAIRFGRGRSFTLHFSEIERMRFFDREHKSGRALKHRVLDPFHRVADYSDFGIRVWFKEVLLGLLPPFSFGFGSKKGEIIIERKEGWNRLRLLMPWLNRPKKSRIFSLNPSDPSEYFQQLQVAYAKWKRMQAPGGVDHET
jgi:hypothetical protein